MDPFFQSIHVYVENAVRMDESCYMIIDILFTYGQLVQYLHLGLKLKMLTLMRLINLNLQSQSPGVYIPTAIFCGHVP